jgi:hypothetical protein
MGSVDPNVERGLQAYMGHVVGRFDDRLAAEPLPVDAVRAMVFHGNIEYMEAQ